MAHRASIVTVSLSVALGGFLMGFDASVISGVVGFIEPEFGLSKLELGWVVASLTLTSTLAMWASGPLSDRFGRRPVLFAAASLFLLSAVACAFAPGYVTLVIARMIGGLGVGAALIVAPMYIAEIAPPEARGKLVSFNQLNIVVGISVAYFSNYLLLRWLLGEGNEGSTWFGPQTVWRWMLGVEGLPALAYLALLIRVPESPRWLLMQGRGPESVAILESLHGERAGKAEFEAIRRSLVADRQGRRSGFRALLQPALRLVLLIGLVVAVLQQITGINAVFFYAPMIFAQSGIGADAAFLQAVLVGLVNVVFTVLAILTIDKFGRRPLLLVGVAGIACFMFLLSYSFNQATYRLSADVIETVVTEDTQALATLSGVSFKSDEAFLIAVHDVIGEQAPEYETALVNAAVKVNTALVLVGILGFVACFAMSLGPVMWVLFSELFPNQVRGLAISVVGLVNSAVSFSVQLVFPWELAQLGPGTTFLLYGVFAVIGLAIVAVILPETKGKSLEELEGLLVGAQK